MMRKNDNITTKLATRLRALLLLLCTTLASCAVWDETSIEIILAPQLVTNASKSNALDKLESLNLYVFNAADVLVIDTILNKQELQSPNGAMIIKGIREGNYTVVCFGNVTKMQTPQVVRGLTTKNEINAIANDCECIDNLYYFTSTQLLRRGDPVPVMLNPTPRYFNVTITVTGLDNLTVPLVEPGVKILNTPGAFNHEGVELFEQNRIESIVPKLQVLPDNNLQSDALCLRFADNSGTMLEISDQEKIVQRVSLQPSSFLTDPEHGTDINILVEFEATTVNIIVNDWFMGSYSIVGLGG